jgi:hypothetical protein
MLYSYYIVFILYPWDELRKTLSLIESRPLEWLEAYRGNSSLMQSGCITKQSGIWSVVNTAQA